jgi:predicted nucleic acid-binding Zn ribbon protein
VSSDETPAGPDLARAALEQAKAQAARRRGEELTAERIAAAGRRAQGKRNRPRRAKGDPTLLGSAISGLVAARGWEGDAAIASVMGRWDSLVGAEIAAKCRPVSLRDGELVITAVSTAWATQLRLLAPQLLGRLRREVGDGVVRTVRVHGPTTAKSTGGWRVAGGRGPRDTYG